MSSTPMLRALRAWLCTAAKTESDVDAAEAAAKAIHSDPWAVVTFAGLLARTKLAYAKSDLGLTIDLRIRDIEHKGVVVRVPKGSPYPAWDLRGKRKRGAFDTPRDMARRTVQAAIDAAQIDIHTGLDPACGTGTFLLAMYEAGVPGLVGFELDSRAAAVARIAVPTADIRVGDGFDLAGTADLIVGNPPFVPPERQNKALRKHLKHRYPWLRGRYDLAVPFAACSVERAHVGGGIGLVLPASLMVQPYAKPMRRMWVNQHHIRTISAAEPFPGAAVSVVCVSMTAGAGPAPLPNHGLAPEALLALGAIPLHPELMPGDPELVEKIRRKSVPLGDIATIDTGVVSHGSQGGKATLLHDTPSPSRVPYVDAKDLQENRTRWLHYRPALMHRPKSPQLFEAPKVLVQRLRGNGPVRAWVDRSGLYAGHTLTVIQPHPDGLTPESIFALITDPLIDGLIRMENGSRLDLYPKDVRSVPVPIVWRDDPTISLERAWDLNSSDVERLVSFRLA